LKSPIKTNPEITYKNKYFNDSKNLQYLS
jgi:hypothetical protein